MMAFRYGLTLAGGATATPEQIEAMVLTAVGYSERFYPAFQLVGWSNHSPREAMEGQLRRSHHYDLCVRLGQLRPVRVNRVSENAYDVYTGALVNKGMRLGDIKPSPLNRNTDWSDYFGRSDMS